MNKKFNSIFSLLFLFSICGCNNDVSSSISNSLNPYTPTTELEKAMYKLINNNFTIDYYDTFGNDENMRNQKFYYTDYAFQGEGDFGFIGVAQGEDLIFRYTITDDEVISGAPLINQNTGTRYESIFDYPSSRGMKDFDFEDLPTEVDSDGYYTYTFGVNSKNDRLVLPIFLRFGETSIPPEELKIKVVKDVITFEAVILSYDFDGDGIIDDIDTVKAIVYDVGKTENVIIKEYLESGKTSKNPLDLRFYKLIHPYLFSHNFTMDLDATKTRDQNGQYFTFKLTEYCTEDAVLDVQNGLNMGAMYNQGVITSFSIVDDKVEIIETIQKDESEFYTLLYGDYIPYTLTDLSYDYFIGYKDDENENVYYLTDSYLIQIVSSLCFLNISEEMYCDRLKIEIINDETNEFKASFDLYNKNTNRDLGVFTARFYDLNNTVIPAVNEYYSFGDDPTTQTKDNLSNVLNKLKDHNYSMDGVTGAGIAKYYNTENYFYAEIYGDSNNNFGYIKQDTHIYEFKITNGVVVVDSAGIDYASGDNPLELPSIGETFGDGTDFGYISTISDELYDLDNYSISNSYGQNYWKMNDSTTSGKLFNYFKPYYNNVTFLSNGCGVIVKDAGENSKITFLTAFISMDGNYQGYTTYTYYDIGTTSHPIIEAYLNNI